MIPYSTQDISQADIDEVVKVMLSEYLTQGPACPSFEQIVAKYCGARFAVAVNSATSALHIACLALGVTTDDRVWTSSITFVASANCALYCGAKIDFVDIDPLTYNMSIDDLANKLRKAEQSGTLPKVIIPVHLCGQPCNMEKIHALAKNYDVKIIEDASHAIGGRYRDGLIGNCRYSDITIFSFHPVKIITTGEGGMAITNNEYLAKKMQLLRSHGITRDATEMTQIPDGPWYYQQIELGYNYRMTDIQAALGISQMRRIDDYITKRHNIARRYDELLKEMPLTIPWRSTDCYSSLHLYVVRLKLDEIDKTHKQVFEALRAARIGVNLHYLPVYLHPFFKKFGFKEGYCREAEHYYAEAISLPIYFGLTEKQQDEVIAAIGAVISK